MWRASHRANALTALKRVGEGSYDQAAAITGHRDLNVLRGYLLGRNQAKLARQAIEKQEAAG